MKQNEFERVAPEEVGIASENIEWLLDKLESGITEPHGLMIMRHGKICAEGWWAPYSSEIRHGMQSHTKTYAATAIGIACTEGILSLEEKIADIFAEEAKGVTSEKLKEITVHDVLCMGCGMEYEPEINENWIQNFLRVPVKHTTGEQFMYNTTGSTLLGAIIRKKTGDNLQEYLTKRLFSKIGICADNIRWLYMPDGLELGGAGIFARTEDNLRLMKLYADNGMWNGERILSTDYIKRATTKQIDTKSESRVNPEKYDNFEGYGYQIWMCKRKGAYRADGALGQFTIVVPDLDMIIAITENAEGSHWTQQVLDIIWEFLDKISVEEKKLHVGEKAEKLKHRLDSLSLPAPKISSCFLRGWEEKKTYEIKEGLLQFEYYGGVLPALGRKAPEEIKRFTLEQKEQFAQISYETVAGDKKFTVDMSGGRKWEILGADVPNEVLASGYWETDTVFVLELRWIETCDTNTYRFRFEENECLIDWKRNELFSMKHYNAKAERVIG